MKTNLRHLRAMLAVIDTGSITRAAAACNVSQPAVTQAIAKLERIAGQPLFLRTASGALPTPAGSLLAGRVRRALGHLDAGMADLSPRLRVTLTSAQLQALIALREAENFTLAARRMGLAQPTVHRAITLLEQDARRSLFERTAHGVIATRPAQALAQAARLAFAELDQAEADLADLLGRAGGRIVIGAMPLSRSHLLPQAIARFRRDHPALPIRALDGPYDDMLAGLRRGEVDFLIGALRDPAPLADLTQDHLFDDTLAMVARPGHPLAGRTGLTVADLRPWPMVVAAEGVPARRAFDRLFAGDGPPASLLETGSLILLREVLRLSDHVGCISDLQVAAEVAQGALVRLDIALPGTVRSIGLTFRRGWLPTRLQAAFLDELRRTAP